MLIDREESENMYTDSDLDQTDILQDSSALSRCQVERDEWKDRYLRTIADLENYRKRVAKDQVTWTQSGQVRVLTELLGLVDDFDRACGTLPNVAQEAQAWVGGITMMHSAFAKIIEKFGVKQMSNYTVFDPEFHEALVHVELPGIESGMITEVVQKGYMLNGTVLRHARVCVAK